MEGGLANRVEQMPGEFWACLDGLRSETDSLLTQLDAGCLGLRPRVDTCPTASPLAPGPT